MRPAGICLGLLLWRVPSFLAEDDPKIGSIEIASEPTSARVYVEGFFAGETPHTVEKLLPRTYRLVVKKSFFADFIADVQVTAGGIKKVEVLLKLIRMRLTR